MIDIMELEKCPCCENRTLGELGVYEICTVCGWEDDPYQFDHPDYEGGANHLSLNQAKAQYFEYRNKLSN